ncbi:hypothetical protein HPB47_018567 [Ixodes persulcatus]|uniref:Uncharacterized protein n=1 Tax=Ixodes persulcatus TaxID=34615 RepID=A0AC60QKE4_IXOPE|nr:hypothetical protein HPB47_018567 [Ixodes persulcatus]
MTTESLPDVDWRPLHFERPIPRDWVCQVCGVVRKETVALPCFHTLCGVCFEGSVALGCACPLDRQAFDKEAVDKVKLQLRHLLKLRVFCWNHAHGCDFVGPASDLQDHFEKDCVHHKTSCPRCHQDVPQLGLVQHYVNECDPTGSAGAMQPDVTFQGGHLHEDLGRARAEIKQAIAELKDGYYGLQASVNSVADDVKLGRSQVNQAIAEVISSVVSQLQSTQSDMAHRGEHFLEVVMRVGDEVNRSMAELKDGYSGLQTSVDTVTEDVRLGRSESSRTIAETVRSLQAELQTTQPGVTYRGGEVLGDLVKDSGEIKQLVHELKHRYSKLQVTVNTISDDVKLGRTVAVTSDQEVVIRKSRMSEEMQQDAVNVAILALAKYNTKGADARYIKEAFEKKYPAAWQCVVGHHFSWSVGFWNGSFIHFKLGQTTILLFRAA